LTTASRESRQVAGGGGLSSLIQIEENGFCWVTSLSKSATDLYAARQNYYCRFSRRTEYSLSFLTGVAVPKICYNLILAWSRGKIAMTTEKQKVIEKDKQIEKRLKAVEIARAVRYKIAQVHGGFPEINSLIREAREGTASSYE